ncbi:MAG: GNAT family N-acetyltransferase [Gammaproteobacteria bacterium]|nr:GNAT family N-acetyltransferase [Gammaproteobacteria bacterium]
MPGAVRTQVTAAQTDDVPALVALLGELFALESDFHPDAEKQARGLRLILKHPDKGRLFVARADGRVIGMASALFTVSTAEGGPVVLLEDVIVTRSWRGRGIGRQLVEHVLCWAKQEGMLRVTLLTDTGNERARCFYERLGFVASAMTVYRYFL